MGFFSQVDLDIRDMVKDGACFHEIKEAYPMLREDEIDAYLANDHDGDYEDGDDGQPSLYEEYQDLYDGDDWDQGQYPADPFENDIEY